MKERQKTLVFERRKAPEPLKIKALMMNKK